VDTGSRETSGLRHCAFRRAMFSKKHADFFGVWRRTQAFLHLVPGNACLVA
jgi:hypothetical protein